MNIALFGGSFDPPHVGHYYIAQRVLKIYPQIDEIWLVPDYKNAFRKIHASFSDRINMLKLHEASSIRVVDEAKKIGGITYSYDLVNLLKKNTNHFYHFLIGSDLLTDFSRWKNYKDLKKMVDFIVYPRKGFEANALPEGFSFIKGGVKYLDVSSSDIRERIKKGLIIKGLVLPEVGKYIRDKGLYK